MLLAWRTMANAWEFYSSIPNQAQWRWSVLPVGIRTVLIVVIALLVVVEGQIGRGRYEFAANQSMSHLLLLIHLSVFYLSTLPCSFILFPLFVFDFWLSHAQTEKLILLPSSILLTFFFALDRDILEGRSVSTFVTEMFCTTLPPYLPCPHCYRPLSLGNSTLSCL